MNSNITLLVLFILLVSSEHLDDLPELAKGNPHSIRVGESEIRRWSDGEGGKRICRIAFFEVKVVDREGEMIDGSVDSQRQRRETIEEVSGRV